MNLEDTCKEVLQTVTVLYIDITNERIFVRVPVIYYSSYGTLVNTTRSFSVFSKEKRGHELISFYTGIDHDMKTDIS